MITTVEINRLRLFARHGVIEQERKVGNEFEVTVHLVVNAEGAMINDDLDSTVNYAEVIDLVKSRMNEPSKLLEHVVYDIRCEIMNRYGSMVTGGMVKLAKLTPPVPADMESVAVTVRW